MRMDPRVELGKRSGNGRVYDFVTDIHCTWTSKSGRVSIYGFSLSFLLIIVLGRLQRAPYAASSTYYIVGLPSIRSTIFNI